MTHSAFVVGLAGDSKTIKPNMRHDIHNSDASDGVDHNPRKPKLGFKSPSLISLIVWCELVPNSPLLVLSVRVDDC